uniref:Galectin n=1 Tax=Cyprinus carpio TaxID=7962 RepID=A0A8C2ECL1_CYPCA
MALFQQLPFFNPTVPFNRPIHGGLLEGIIVTVCGRVSPHSSRFQVDLMHGSDIVLHFNPRYEGGSEYVVHNTCHYGHWGSEERKYETPFPRAQTFALQILVTQETYKVIISYFIIYNELQAYFLLDRTINQSFWLFLDKSDVDVLLDK